MPSRPFIVIVVGAWLAAMGWLIVESWRPSWQQGERPRFAVDLADEVAPQNATWIILRDDKPAGRAESRIAPRKDGTFELTTRLREVNLSRGNTQVKILLIALTRTASHEGELIRIEGRATLNVKRDSSESRVDATIHGRVTDGVLNGEIEFERGGNRSAESFGPIVLGSTDAFTPFQPLLKYPPLKPGQTWPASNVDLTSAILNGACEPAGSASLRPTELTARVEPEAERIVHRDKRFTCHVIVFRGKDIVARSWVDVSDGKVIRQEATLLGDKLALERD